ncbi:hypothetical protein K0M31_004516, partial [Melipona bicolor]
DPFQVSVDLETMRVQQRTASPPSPTFVEHVSRSRDAVAPWNRSLSSSRPGVNDMPRHVRLPRGKDFAKSGQGGNGRSLRGRDSFANRTERGPFVFRLMSERSERARLIGSFQALGAFVFRRLPPLRGKSCKAVSFRRDTDLELGNATLFVPGP